MNDRGPGRGDRVAPLYEKVKKYILDRIQSGEWAPAQRILSENELVRELRVSRMTVNRAVRELADGGILTRLPGVGTFVAEPRQQGHLLEIHNIADEIKGRGHRHGAQILSVSQEPASGEVAARMHLEPGAPVFHSVIVHYENDVPIQLEDRYVHPGAAPDYLQIDFTTTTPSEHLIRVAPLRRVEHVVQAVVPAAAIRRHLEMKAGEPCLLLLRRTWARGLVASTASLYHPGGRYQLGDRFSPPLD